MKFFQSLLPTAVTLFLASLSAASAFAQDGGCVSSERHRATIAFASAVQSAQAFAAPRIVSQVNAVSRLYAHLTPDEVVSVIEANANQDEVPDSVSQKVLEAQRAFDHIQCLGSEHGLETDIGPMCRQRGVPNSDASVDSDQYPIAVTELYLDGYFITACSDLVTREGAPGRSFDMRICSKIDIESGEVFGNGLADAIDASVVDDEVFAYVDDIRLDDGLSSFVSTWVQNHCPESAGDE